MTSRIACFLRIRDRLLMIRCRLMRVFFLKLWQCYWYWNSRTLYQLQRRVTSKLLMISNSMRRKANFFSKNTPRNWTICLNCLRLTTFPALTSAATTRRLFSSHSPSSSNNDGEEEFCFSHFLIYLRSRIALIFPHYHVTCFSLSTF